jgi:hypothetical protein
MQFISKDVALSAIPYRVVAELEGNPINITDTNFRELQRLWKELDFKPETRASPISQPARATLDFKMVFRPGKTQDLKANR